MKERKQTNWKKETNWKNERKKDRKKERQKERQKEEVITSARLFPPTNLLPLPAA